jgi:hypothetical protein
MSYSSIYTHRAMVFDDVRNRLYANALRNAIGPDTVVLDLGAGFGTHGLIAAVNGARRVYCVEPQPVIRIVSEIAAANGVAGRIVPIEGRIEDVELPEKVDVIVSALTGNLLFSEDLLPSLLVARDRHLKSDGMGIPDVARLWVCPVTAPSLHTRYVSGWGEPRNGIDFSAVRRLAANDILWLTRDEVPHGRLAAGAVVTAVDLLQASDVACHASVDIEVEQAGLCHGLLGWISMRLGDRWLSTDPALAEVHWSSAFLPIDPPVEVAVGDTLSIAIERPVQSDWTWTVTAGGERRRHSSFLAGIDGFDRLRRMAPAHVPGLNARGEQTLRALELMHDGRSNIEVARSLSTWQPGAFPNLDDALRLAQGLALSLGK